MEHVKPSAAARPVGEASQPEGGRIPVYLLSGFLGAGKSTLLNRLLSDPAFHDSAVIINEFGDVPIDHLLVRQGETTINQISTGCLCCSGTTDIRTTLFDLHCAAIENTTGRFSRVIVEMSGLGDPAPLVNALSANQNRNGKVFDKTVDSVFYLAGFISLFDAVTGLASVEGHFEALKQVAFADRIVLTKTDLLSALDEPADVAALSHDLRALNASADIVDGRDPDLSALFSPRPYSAVDRGEDVAGWLALEAALATEAGHASQSNAGETNSRHGPGIRTFSIVADRPLPERRFHQFLAVLQQSAGQRLLRVKGIVATEETPDCPLVVHAVQHALSDPVRLDAWPDDDHRTRLVFITSGVDPEPVRALFSALIDQAPFSFIGSFKRFHGALTAFLDSKFTNLTTRTRKLP
ncbi:CobW family GTP-binding protein [Hoeflea sp.]|uniref:CobW family GTP-binding protein n=1 Tax=Hoeflea sp. TaxID=1940281 RepID=UPI003B027942